MDYGNPKFFRMNTYKSIGVWLTRNSKMDFYPIYPEIQREKHRDEGSLLVVQPILAAHFQGSRLTDHSGNGGQPGNSRKEVFPM